MSIQFVENFAKAMALATLGVPAVNHEGKPIQQGDCWEFRGITTEQLKENNFTTLQDAEDAGFVGKVIYAFGDSDNRRLISKAFDTVFHKADATLDYPETINLSAAKGKIKAIELIAIGMALFAKNRRKFSKRQREVRAKLLVMEDGEVSAILDRRTTPENRAKLT